MTHVVIAMFRAPDVAVPRSVSTPALSTDPVTAPVTCPNATIPVIELPDWVGREVTADRRDRNSALIRSGLAGLSLDDGRLRRGTG